MGESMVMPVLKIDPEFQNKIPPLTEEEYKQLKENIIDAGEVYEPIITWKGVIVDGHNRWKIIQEVPGLIWKAKEIDFPDKWAAFDWMYKNQLGRRNLTEQQRTYMIGKMYEARKKSIGGNGSNQYTYEQIPQNAEIAKVIGTSRIIAKELGINHATVERAEKFAEAVDSVREVSPETADKLLNGEKRLTREEIKIYTKADPEERPRMIEQINHGEKVTPVSVPDKIVHKPETKYNGGGTKEYREQRDRIAAIAADMYDPTTVPEYDLDMLLKDIGWAAETYIRTLRNQICDHRELAKENRETVENILDEIKDDIEKIKEEIVK